MQKQFKYKNVTWVDLVAPTAEEVSATATRFNIHPLAAGELATRSLRPKVDLYDDYIYLVLHFPNHSGTTRVKSEEHDTIEVDFIVGKDWLVTTSYEELASMHEFGKIIEANAILADGKKDIHAGHLMYDIIKHLYQSLERNLESINFTLKKAEAKIFAGNEREMVKVLAKINKKLLDFRSTLKTHREILRSLEAGGKEFFGESFVYYLRAIIGEFEKAWDILESNRDFFNELKQTNESMLQIKTAEATKVFSMLAFVTFPLTLLATVLGLRAPSTPLVDMPYGFWIIAGAMLALVMLMMAFFKYKKWL